MSNDSFDEFDTPAEFGSTPPPAPPQALQQAGFHCPYCAYDLTGAVIGGVCPECGQHIDSRHLRTAPTNSMATTCMVLGILSVCMLLACTPVTLILGPLSIFFGVQARKKQQSGLYSTSSKGMTLAGLLCGGISLGLFCLFALAFLLFNVLVK